MRLQVEADLIIRIHEADGPDINRDSIRHHLDTMSDRLREAYEVGEQQSWMCKAEGIL
jgi:hypothetical protein